MARTPADATRFTATGPYASSSSSFTANAPSSAPSSSGAGSQIQFGASAPTNETPQQKIARLRAAAQAAKHVPESSYDRTVRIGRTVVDRAHKFTALGLIGLTVLTAMVATAGITDMILHNRRRRNEWLAQKRAEEAREVAVARVAIEEGIASEDQVLLVNRERARRESEEAKKTRPGVFRRSTSWLFGGLSKEEQKGGRLGAEAALASGGEQILGEKEGRGVLQAVQEKVESKRREVERVEDVIRPLGGPLDREAERSLHAAADAGKSWMSWLTGR